MGRLKTIFISDVHIGSPHSEIMLLNKYLDALSNADGVTIDRIYLVGDIIDLWKLKRSFYWNDHYNIFIRKILGFTKSGTKVVWLMGNHEENLDKMIGYEFGNVLITDECIFMAGNTPFLVTHGHIGDKLINYSKWLVRLGDYLYSGVLKFDRSIKWTKRWLGFDVCVARTVKQNVKAAANFVSNFANFTIDYSIRKGCSGVIFGHIHTPDMQTRLLNNKYFHYINIGDMVENRTLIEYDYKDSAFTLIKLNLDEKQESGYATTILNKLEVNNV